MPIVAPAAPDLDTIFDVEGNIEPFAVKALRTSGICEVDPERSQVDQNTPRVDVRLHLGACISRTKVPTGATSPREALPTAWNCTFVFDVVTDRVNEQQRGAHGKYRAKVRRLGAQFFDVLRPMLPYHRIEKMQEAGTVPNMENTEAKTEDISRIQFAGIVTVRDTAWPAGQ